MCPKGGRVASSTHKLLFFGQGPKVNACLEPHFLALSCGQGCYSRSRRQTRLLFPSPPLLPSARITPSLRVTTLQPFPPKTGCLPQTWAVCCARYELPALTAAHPSRETHPKHQSIFAPAKPSHFARYFAASSGEPVGRFLQQPGSALGRTRHPLTSHCPSKKRWKVNPTACSSDTGTVSGCNEHPVVAMEMPDGHL